MTEKTIARQKGFSLLELLVAVLIIALLSIVLLQAITYSYILNAANRGLSVATTHAQYVMEDIKGTNYDLIQSRINNGYWDWNGAAITAQNLTPLVNEAIDTSVNTVATNLLRVTVTDSWQDNNGRARQVSLETYFSNPPEG